MVLEYKGNRNSRARRGIESTLTPIRTSLTWLSNNHGGFFVTATIYYTAARDVRIPFLFLSLSLSPFFVSPFFLLFRVVRFMSSILLPHTPPPPLAIPQPSTSDGMHYSLLAGS